MPCDERWREKALITSDSRLQKGGCSVGTNRTNRSGQQTAELRRNAPALDVCDVDGGRLDARRTVAENLGHDCSVHGFPRGGVVKVKSSGGDAVVSGYVCPEVVCIEHAMHAIVFVGDSFGAISVRG